jgi:opacity protein-like surface antigen
MTAVLALSPSVLFVPSAYGEAYIGAQFGVTLPQSLSNGQLNSAGVLPADISNQALKSSLMGGVKLGFYLPQARWFGLETEAFYTTPNIKQQTVTFSNSQGSASVELPGLYQRVITWAPVNFMFRYPKTRLQPYIGIGPGIFFGQITDPSVTSGNNTQSSNWKIGLNSQAGLRYYITRQWAVSGEAKYNYVQMSYQDTANLFGFKANYSALIFAFGVSYHF